MRPDVSERLLAQLDQAIALSKEIIANSQYNDLSDLEEADVHRAISRGRAAVERVSGRDSVYTRQVEEILTEKQFDGVKLRKMLGVVEALRVDAEAGYLQELVELIHGGLFGDFLEMARHLLEESYKDPAAVVAGTALEAQLRQPCGKSGIDTDVSTKSGFRPKKADRMNADLAGSGVYSKLDQKNVTAWLDLRNKAAHGRFGEYTREQVSLMVSGIQDFITLNPA